MFSENQKISVRQLQILLILDIFGTGIITLPRRTAQAAGTNAWISVLIGGMIMVAFSFVLTSLSEQFPQKNFVEIIEQILSKPIGKLISIGFIIKILMTIGLQLRIFCEIIRQTMLFQTPIAVTSILMILVAAYAAMKGYECRARAGEVLIILIFIPLILVYITAMFSTDFSNLLPIYMTNSKGLMKGAAITAFSFQGLELLLLAYPFLNRQKGNKREFAATIAVITALMTITTILTIGKFGDITVQSKLFPALQMMDTVDFPGAFIERQDILIMWFWVVSAFASVSAGIYFTSFIFSKILEKEKKRKIFLIAALPILFFISILPEDVASAYLLLGKVTLYGGGFYLFLLPTILFILNVFQKKGGIQNEKLS